MEMENLTEEQNNALSRFREFTHIDSVETCHQYLTAHEWDVERAVETALVSIGDDQLQGNTEPTPSAPDASMDVSNVSPTPRTVPIERNNGRSTPLFQLILSFLYSFYLKIQSYIPWTLLYVFYAFFRSLFLSARPVDPIREIDEYCEYFDQQYGTQHPPFYRGKLSQALHDAQREVRLLFIYLHDKNSPLCDRFCREVLCEEAMRSIVADHLLWSASSDTQEGALASRLLRNPSYPCLSLVAHHGSQQIVQMKLDRYSDADACLAEILNSVQNADQTLQFNRERRDDRSSRDRLLEEQNRAYLDSLKADQEKAEQRKREEIERRKLEEEQRRVEEEKQRKLQECAAFRDRIRQSFPEEPSANETDIIQISIRLPSSEPIRRRFRRSDPAKLLFEFAWTDSNVPDQFELLWGYPRKRYQYEQIGQTILADVMTGRTETCFLEQIDDEK